MRAKVYITPKEGVLDPQGQTVERALHSLGYTKVQGVRIGKYVELEFDAASPAEAEGQIREMCDKLLSNPVIEDFTFEIQD
ncbi:MAG: phosphoribosylformylglycinamidine synthase subunit PurS [Deltaproteobacteria bacterium]|nr:phosphoribosylformylglycinamidine synthase subunit PurS [Deltaproteobacteria bacterium]